MNQKNFFYHRMIFYISGLLIMSVGSNLFLKAALGVAPSCTIALTLTYLFPFHSYASFNFLINTAFLIGEIAVMRQLKKSQLIQLALTFLYSAFIECTSRGLYFIQLIPAPASAPMNPSANTEVETQRAIATIKRSFFINTPPFSSHYSVRINDNLPAVDILFLQKKKLPFA